MVDEVVEVAKSVLNTNPNSMLFIFQVQSHQAIEKASMINHRRLLEDKLLGCFGWVNAN